MDTSSVPLKRCSRKEKCVNPLGSWLPETGEHFRPRGGTSTSLRTDCRCCERASHQRYAAENPEKVKAKSQRYAETHQDELRERSRKYEAEHREQRRAARRQQYRDNVDEMRDRARLKRAADPEKQREYQRRSYQKHADKQRAERRCYYAEHREQERAYRRNWYVKNADHARKYSRQYALQNPDKVKIAQRRWQASHRQELREYDRRRRAEYPEKIRLKVRRRVSKQQGVPFDFSPKSEARMYEYWGYSCAVCGRTADMWTTLATDHWIALSDPRHDNPGTVALNMIPLCHGKKDVPAGTPCCNNSKINKDPEQWLISRFGKRKAKQILKRIHTYFDWVRQQDSVI